MQQAGKIVRLVMCICILSYALNSCNKTAINPQTFPTHPAPAVDTLHNLRHMIDSVPSSDLFLLALQRTGYDSLLNQTGAFYTLLIPTDSVLIAAGYTKEVITYLAPSLLFSGIIMNQVWNGQLADSMLDGADGYVRATTIPDPASSNNVFKTYSVAKQGGPTGGLWIDGVQVSQERSGIWASNGYIHVVSTFYTPPLATAWTILQSRPEFTYFVAACRLDDSVVLAQGQTDQYTFNVDADSTIFTGVSLNGSGAPVSYLTFFVPTNQAFIDAGFKTIDDIRTYALTYVYDQTGLTVSPLDSLIYAHWMPRTNLYYYDLLKNPNLNERQAADLRPTMETELYNISYYANTDPYQQGLPTYGQTYPYKGILNFQVADTSVTITCNSINHPPAATVVEHDILCANSVILHAVDHLFWPY